MNPSQFRHVQTLKALLKDAHDHGSGSQLHELHHYGVALEALDGIEAEQEHERALNKRYREALEEIAEHTVVSEGEFPDDNCDWHCTLTMQARAKDALDG